MAGDDDPTKPDLSLAKDRSLELDGKPRRLAIVHWRDSSSHPQSWTRFRDIDEECGRPAVGYSVGWIIKANSDVVVICPSVIEIFGRGGGIDVSGGTTVPRESVVSIEYLK